MPFPDFSEIQRKTLQDLGVCEEQIQELRKALLTVRSAVQPKAARNEVLEQLDAVIDLADALDAKLRALQTTPAISHQSALQRIEQEFWQRAGDLSGPNVHSAISPLLELLAGSARSAKAGLPEVATRHSVSDPRPIIRIEEALYSGWLKRHGPFAESWVQPEGGEKAEVAAMAEAAKRARAAPPYPREFKASVSEGTYFREIVALCYEAVGYPRFPKRALEAFVKRENAQRKELRDAWKELLK